MMRLIFKLILLAMLLSIAWTAFAQDTAERAPIDPDLIARAERGDAEALYDVGVALFAGNAEDVQSARPYLESALAAARPDQFHMRADAHQMLGYIFLVEQPVGDLESAEHHLGAAIALARDLPHEQGAPILRWSLHNLANVKVALSGAENTILARNYMEEAVRLYDDTGIDELEYKIQAMMYLGVLHDWTAKHQDAIDIYREAIDLTPALDEPWSIWGKIMDNIGASMQGLARYEDAIDVHRSARSLYAGVHGERSVQVGDTYLNEGINLEGLGDYEAALEVYETARDIYRQVLGEDDARLGWVINNIAVIHWRLENYQHARDLMDQAKPIIEKHEGRFTANVATTDVNIGIFEYNLGNHDAAIRSVMRALVFIRDNPETTLTNQRWAYDTLARAFRAKGDLDRAIAFGKLAVNAQQQVRSYNPGSETQTRALRDKWRWLYEHLADMLIEQGRFAEAQAVLNMEKEQETFEFLRRDGGAGLRETRALLTDDELGEQERIEALAELPVAAVLEHDRLVAKLKDGTATAADEDRIFVLQDSIQVALDDFEAQVDAFLAEAIVPRQEVYREQLAAVGSYDAMLRRFDERVALIQIAALGDATHIFLTLPDLSLHRQSPVGDADLSRLTFKALSEIDGRKPEAVETLAELYDVLIRPVQDELATYGVEVVMFNVDGALRYVPFAALHDGDRYLVERFAISLYTPTVDTQFERTDRRADSSAGFGVTAAHPGFSPLPGVQRELESVFVGEDEIGVLSGPAALDDDFSARRLNLVLQTEPSVLHIASHFNLVPGREDDSFLLLGDGSHLPLSDIRTEGWLSFAGIDLVTLSACQTAVGGGDGSEIEGFGAIAQLNGASSVMASLWPVADEATAQLMSDFYDSMIGQGLSKAAALREAQLAMIAQGASVASVDERAAKSMHASPVPKVEDVAHPYFWSPFVLMGNWL